MPSTRVSSLLVRQRLVAQMQADQSELYRLQAAISTGQRITTPSEDAPSALRAISIQKLLERKQQVKVNLNTSQSYLGATDAALANVSNLLTEVRGTAVSVVGTTASDTQRAAAAQEVDRAIEQLVDTGNQQFRGRYLFGGSAAGAAPFERRSNSAVRYSGDERHINSYSDIDVLFETNYHGHEVFGAISEAIRGEQDFNPIVSENTRVADLRGGQGVSAGSIAISDGVNSSIVDISAAETLGDVARLIESHPPAGRTVTVTVTHTGLNVALDASGGGALSIVEVGGGTTVSELGILQDTPSGLTRIGDDLDPRVTLTTSLRDILGTRARATVVSNGLNNDIVVEAAARGATLNNVTVRYVDGGASAFGNEAAVYNAGAQTLTVTIANGLSTADQVIAAINAEGTFSASLERHDGLTENTGSGVVHDSTTEPTAVATTAGGAGVEFDSTGVQIVNEGVTHTISFASAETIEDVLNLLNGSPAGVAAEISAAGDRIDIRSRSSGADFSIGENGGATATQLGVRTFTTTTRLDDLNYGRGVVRREGEDFRIRRKDGVTLDIDISSATTIGDVLDAINNHAQNQDPNRRVVARLANFGNGIELTTTDTAITSPFKVLRVTGSSAAEDLGLIAVGATESAPATVSGGTETISGNDVNPAEVRGVFTALSRLRGALLANDQREITRAIELLDDSSLDLNFARAGLGARQQGLDVLQDRLENEEINLRENLSQELDTDIIAAISELTSRQAAFEASLRATAQIFQLSLLNFL